MIKYYSKTLRCEVFEKGDDTLTNEDIPWWFQTLPNDKQVEFNDDGTPCLVDAMVYPSPTASEIAEERIRQELDAIIGDLTPAESMYLMLQYSMTKMNPDASDEPTPTTHLTPTGEDIVTWGDRIASELEAKMIELRNL